MAVPGADRRKSIDGNQTDGVDATVSPRSELGGSSPAFCSDNSPGVDGARAAGMGPFADNTGKREVQVLDGIAETDDEFASEPPAIEVDTRTTVVTKRPGGSFRSRARTGRQLRRTRYLSALFGTRSERSTRGGRRMGPSAPRPDGSATVVEPRNPTVITK